MKAWITACLLALGACTGSVPAHAQANYPTVGGGNVPAHVIDGTIGGFASYPIAAFPGTDGNRLFVHMEPTQIFWDDFGTGTLDTTNRWTAPTTGGGGNATAANNQVGATTLGSGTNASGWSILQTQTAFAGRNPGFVFGQFQVALEAQVSNLFTTNAYRFFGFYSAPGGPTSLLPLTNAFGFAIKPDGKLYAVTFASGTENIIADLSAYDTNCLCTPQSLVADGKTHKYVLYFRGDNGIFKIDDRFVTQFVVGSQGPDVNTLAIGAMAVAGVTPPASSATVTLAQVTAADTSRNNMRLCDGTFGWRCASVNAAGGLSFSPALSSSASAGITPVVTGSAASGLVLKATPGNLYSVYAECSAACWLMIFNSTTVPADGATTAGVASGNLQDCLAIPTGSNGSINYTPGPPEVFTVGISAAISSTTCATKTAATTGFIHGSVQ